MITAARIRRTTTRTIELDGEPDPLTAAYSGARFVPAVVTETAWESDRGLEYRVRIEGPKVTAKGNLHATARGALDYGSVASAALVDLPDWVRPLLRGADGLRAGDDR